MEYGILSRFALAICIDKRIYKFPRKKGAILSIESQAILSVIWGFSIFIAFVLGKNTGAEDMKKAVLKIMEFENGRRSNHHTVPDRDEKSF